MENATIPPQQGDLGYLRVVRMLRLLRLVRLGLAPPCDETLCLRLASLVQSILKTREVDPRTSISTNEINWVDSATETCENFVHPSLASNSFGHSDLSCMFITYSGGYSRLLCLQEYLGVLVKVSTIPSVATLPRSQSAHASLKGHEDVTEPVAACARLYCALDL